MNIIEKPLIESSVAIAVDNSGSTSGSILERELNFANKLMKIFQSTITCIKWNSNAKIIDSFKGVGPEGCTNPSEIIPLLNENILVLITDGQIDNSEMSKLKTRFSNADIKNVICVLTLSNNYDKYSTIKEWSRQCNMSIGDSLMGSSDNVLVVVLSKDKTKVLSSSGSFSNEYPSIELDENLIINTLPDFTMTKLKNIILAQLPEGMISIDDKYFFVNDLYEKEIETSDLECLMNRNLFSKYNCEKLEINILRQLNNIAGNNRSDELKQIQEELYDAVGTDRHQEMLTKYKDFIASRRSNEGDLKQRRHLLQKFLGMLTDYRKDNSAVVLGSNRASRCNFINDKFVDEWNACLNIECPIYLGNENACIMLCGDINTDFIMKITNDATLYSPFSNCINEFVKLFSKGIYGETFARTATFNPYTRADITGIIPLTNNKTCLVSNLSKYFGMNKFLPHLVLTFIGAIIKHIDVNEWAEKDIYIEFLKQTGDIKFNKSLQLETTDMVPLVEAVGFTLNNFEVARHKNPRDLEILIRYAEILNIDFNKDQLMGLINVMDIVYELYNKHKQGEDMYNYIFSVDEYGHPINENRDLKGYIARKIMTLSPYMKIQDAVDKLIFCKPYDSLRDSSYDSLNKESCALYNLAIKGVPIDFDEMETLIINRDDKVDDIHMTTLSDDQYKLLAELGEDNTTCLYCGATFEKQYMRENPLFAHLREVYGKGFYCGKKIVREVLEANPDCTDEITIYKNVRDVLRKKYGSLNPYINSVDCKNHVLKLIRLMLN